VSAASLEAPAPPLPPAPAAGEPAPSHSAVSVTETFRRAQVAFAKKQYAKVISLALPIALRNPGRAWRLVGPSACKLRDLKRANEAYRYLDAPGKKYLVIICASESIQLIDGQLRFQTEIK
jgi:hypothetical protein